MTCRFSKSKKEKKEKKKKKKKKKKKSSGETQWSRDTIKIERLKRV